MLGRNGAVSLTNFFPKSMMKTYVRSRDTKRYDASPALTRGGRQLVYKNNFHKGPRALEGLFYVAVSSKKEK